MTYNYNKLKGKIKEKYGTQGAFASALGVSERTMSLKLNNKIYFRQDEIYRIVELLGINKYEIQRYFFDYEVQ